MRCHTFAFNQDHYNRNHLELIALNKNINKKLRCHTFAFNQDHYSRNHLELTALNKSITKKLRPHTFAFNHDHYNHNHLELTALNKKQKNGVVIHLHSIKTIAVVIISSWPRSPKKHIKKCVVIQFVINQDHYNRNHPSEWGGWYAINRLRLWRTTS